MCHETITHLCLPVTEKILRTVAIYAFLVVGLRLAGKRELGQWTSFDLVVLITIANAVQNAILGPENSLTGGIIGGATLLVTNYVVARLCYQFPAVDRLLEGREVALFENGEINARACQRELITKAELLTAARRQGARSLDEVDRITMERNGNVSVILKQDASLKRLLEEVGELKRLISAKRA